MSKLKYISYILLGLSVIIAVYFFFLSGAIDDKDYAQVMNSDSGEGLWKYIVLDGFLGWTYVLTGVAALLALVLPVIGIIQNPKNLRKILTNVGVMVAVVVIAAAVAFTGSEPSSEFFRTTFDNIWKGMIDSMPPGMSVAVKDDLAFGTLLSNWKWTSLGLIVTYILTAAALLSIVAGAITNAIKNR